MSKSKRLLISAIALCGGLAGPAKADPIISINDVTLAEGDSGFTFFDFLVSLSAPSTDTVQVFGNTADGTAFAPGDYSAVSSSLGTFSPGQTQLAFRVLVSGDITPELDEIFYVNLSDAVGATIGKSQGIGTILDDDTPTAAAPEPATLASGALGLVLVAAGSWRRWRRFDNHGCHSEHPGWRMRS
jgi:hypothetical protein